MSEKKNDYIVATEKRKVWSTDILTKILEKIVKNIIMWGVHLRVERKKANKLQDQQMRTSRW